MLSGVIALVTMGDGRERPHASPDEPQQEVNELRLRVRMRDALLTNESLAALPIALTVHLPCAFWSPAVVEITGCVPTADFRDDVVRLTKRELSWWRTGAETAARFVVEPLIGPREAARDPRRGLRDHSRAPEAWVRTCSSPMMTGHR
jgi:hypothetical protein